MPQEQPVTDPALQSTEEFCRPEVLAFAVMLERDLRRMERIKILPVSASSAIQRINERAVSIATHEAENNPRAMQWAAGRLAALTLVLLSRKNLLTLSTSE